MSKRKPEELEQMEDMAVEAVEATEDGRVWEVKGEVVSRADFVRYQFMELKKTKTEISKEFGIDYGPVYQSTMNMDNGVETSGGRSKVYVTLVDENGNEEKLSRNEYITRLVSEGLTDRREIVKKLHDVGDEKASYQTVYNVTKDMEGFESQGRSGAKQIEVDGKTLSLKEFAVTKTKEGLTVAEIAKEASEILGEKIAYQVIYGYVGVKTRFSVKFNTMEELQQIYDEHKAIFVEEAANAEAEEEVTE